MMRIPYWTIKGTFTLKSPLHLGSGLDVEDQNFKQEDGTPIWVAQVAMDCHGKPYLPASSLKGALRALAVKCGWNDVDKYDVDKFFGQDVTTDNNGKKASTPGNLEICNAYVANQPALEYEPHVKIDPVTGTAEHQKLFHTQVVPTGTQFEVEIHLNGNAAKDDIEKLLGLLDATTAANEFSLGAKCMDGRGEVAWEKGAINQVDATVFSDWWNKVASLEPAFKAKLALLHDAEKLDFRELNAIPTKPAADKQSLSFSFDLAFHSPFMVLDPSAKRKPGDTSDVNYPRLVNNDKLVLLPASSLRGALMGQARRILNTMEVPDKEKLLTALFGSTSQRAALQLKDQTAPYKSQVMHMTAIDRLTGGGKDGALFTAAPAHNPVFKNCEIKIDTARLGEHKDKVIGLMALLLRDLDEGDITFGWGAAKGLGRCTAKSLKSFETALSKAGRLQSFVDALRPSQNAPVEGTHDWEQEAIIAPAPENRGAAAGDFHNPYAFIPFHIQPNENWISPESLKTSKHNHSKYHSETYSGRIVCQLINRTPMFIGAGPDPIINFNGAKKLTPFKLGSNLALPSTSLRGLFSSLHETISSSNVRVMTDGDIGVRYTSITALPFQGYLVMGFDEDTNIEEWCIEMVDDKDLFVIDPLALSRFKSLVAQRFFADQKRDYPRYKTKGNPKIEKHPTDKKTPPQLMENQLVYFDTNDDGVVIEIAWSQIWRKRVEKDTNNELKAYRYLDLLTDSAGCDAPPLGASTRSLLSPTELLFGVVEDTKLNANRALDKPTFTAASKISFGFGHKAQTTNITRCGEMTLKIMASPKLPSPAMYLAKNDGSFPQKSEFAQRPSQFKLKGRKQYLHALRDDLGTVKNLTSTGEVGGQTPPWKTSDPQDNANQKVTINPIDKGNSFVFEVDFKNLSKEELGTLCASLRPNNEFEHKLGMGKPLGLGSVKVDFLGLYLIDRQARYQDDEFKAATQTRYHHVWRNSNIQISADNWPSHLQVEAKLETSIPNINPHDLANQAMTNLKNRAPQVFQAVSILGNHQLVTKPVHYPQLSVGTVIKPARGNNAAVVSKGLLEENLYEWFMHNDKNMRQSLDAVTTTVPVLKRQ